MQPEPFNIHVDDDVLADMHRRLETVRWADDFGNEDWRYGIERGWLQSMAEYWANGFDWRAQEAAMNRYPHFRVEIDGIPIHFMHVRSGTQPSIPLILTHGWPWSFWDWNRVIDPLTSGSAPGPAFDLVIPSLNELDLTALEQLFVS